MKAVITLTNKFHCKNGCNDPIQMFYTWFESIDSQFLNDTTNIEIGDIDG